MAFIVEGYFIFNDFLIRHIPEIVFSLIALLIIFVEPYLIYVERGVNMLLGVLTRNPQQPGMFQVTKLDSFIVFILLIVLILPFVKHYLINFLENILVNENLTFYMIVIFVGAYFYYVFVYRKQHSKHKN
tara:strand:+ start:2812 stop:3201 length:390 start_codon:yes stop_codon:yes gene_type:complete